MSWRIRSDVTQIGFIFLYADVAPVLPWLVGSVDTMIRQGVNKSPGCKSLRRYTTSNCLCCQGALWRRRHRKTDPRAVCPRPSFDQSEASERRGPSAEPVPRDDPSVWQTPHETGEAGQQLVWEEKKKKTFLVNTSAKRSHVSSTSHVQPDDCVSVSSVRDPLHGLPLLFSARVWREE